jgi:hypothetical protein
MGKGIFRPSPAGGDVEPSADLTARMQSDPGCDTLVSEAAISYPEKIARISTEISNETIFGAITVDTSKTPFNGLLPWLAFGATILRSPI